MKARSRGTIAAPALGTALLALAACQPPAADDYVERVAVGEQRAFASEPLDSPDTEFAVWALNEGRLLYGNPGQKPLVALACEGQEVSRQVVITRFAAADPQAKALMPLIGNGHVERLKVDAVWNGRAWLWQGSYPAGDPRLDVLANLAQRAGAVYWLNPEEPHDWGSGDSEMPAIARHCTRVTR